MIIGIDIDDTIANTIEKMLKYADKYDKEVLNGKGKVGQIGEILDRHYLKHIYEWQDKQKIAFFEKYYQIVLETVTIKEDAAEIIQQLKQEGNTILLITARWTSIADCDTEKITQKWLEENKVPYDALIVNAQEKLEICIQKKVDVLIEDSYLACEEMVQAGRNAILMSSKMNQNIQQDPNITRVENWKQVYESLHQLQKMKMK